MCACVFFFFNVYSLFSVYLKNDQVPLSILMIFVIFTSGMCIYLFKELKSFSFDTFGSAIDSSKLCQEIYHLQPSLPSTSNLDPSTFDFQHLNFYPHNPTNPYIPPIPNLPPNSLSPCPSRGWDRGRGSAPPACCP